MHWYRLDQFSVLVASALVTQSFVCRGARMVREKSLPRLDLTAAALVALALLARLATPSALLHSHFHAYGIVAAVLEFPNPAQYRASFGQASFAILGAIASVFGRNVDVVIRTNIVLQTLALVLASEVVGRAGGIWARRGALAAGALSPLMLRIAASEDAHNVSVAAGMLALLWADTWRRQGGGLSDALGVVGAVLLCVDSRQGMFLWPAFVTLLAVHGARRPVSRSDVLSLFVFGLALLTPVLMVRMHETGDRISYVGYALGPLLCQEPAFWRQHPLLNDPTAWPTLALAIAATWFVGRRSVTVFVLALASGMTFVLTYAVSCVPMVRDGTYQRLALFMLIAALAGAGVGKLAQCSTLRPRGGFYASAMIAILLLAPALKFPHLRHSIDPFYTEISVIHRHLQSRGPTTLVLPSRTDDDAGMVLTSRLINAPNVRIVYAGTPEALSSNALRYEGLDCYATNLYSCVPRNWRHEFSTLSSALRQFHRVFFELCTHGSTSPFFAQCLPPSGAVPACTRQIRHGVFEPWSTVAVAQDQLPIVYFTARQVTLGVWRDPPVVRP